MTETSSKQKPESTELSPDTTTKGERTGIAIPLHHNNLFGNEIKKEIELKWKLNKNKNGSCTKLKMKVHSRNHYTSMIFLEIK